MESRRENKLPNLLKKPLKASSVQEFSEAVEYLADRLVEILPSNFKILKSAPLLNSFIPVVLVEDEDVLCVKSIHINPSESSSKSTKSSTTYKLVKKHISEVESTLGKPLDIKVAIMDMIYSQVISNRYLVYDKLFKNINNKLLKPFKCTLCVPDIPNVGYGFEKVKLTMFNRGLLNNFPISRIRGPIFNLDQKSRINDDLMSNLTIELTKEKVDELLNRTIIYGRPGAISTELRFSLEEVIIKTPNLKGFNNVKDKNIVEGCVCRVIKTNKKYSNFEMDDIVEVVSIFENSKTKQRNSALCFSKKSDVQGLIYIKQLKRI